MSLHTESLNASLSRLSVGEVIYIERERDQCASLQRAVSAKSRWPKSMQGWQIKTSTYTAVGSAAVGDIKFLVRVERVV